MKYDVILSSVLRFGVLSFALMFYFSACQKEAITNNAPIAGSDLHVGVSDRSAGTIVDVAAGNPNFSTLVAAVQKTGLVASLSRATLNATVLAPTNDAFAQLPDPFNNAANISNITDARTIAALGQILKYHVIMGTRTAAELTNGSYGTLRTAVTPQNHLVFVGRNTAGNVYINGNAKVVTTDVFATNGVIHAIDKVLLPPSQAIGQVAMTTNNFSALYAALKATGLTNTFFEPTYSFTVFAPTDAAFAKLPAPFNTASAIKGIRDAAAIQTLRDILLYHTVKNRVFSVDLREGIQAASLQGGSVSISLAGGAKVKGNGNASAANITATDILAINGVIHAIDQVLMP